jgi:hypothetical protein
MRTWMLASLLFAVAAMGGDREVETSAQFFDRAVAASQRSSPFQEFSHTDRVTAAKCCKVCTKGKPCGDTCIAKNKVCHVGPGCAC